MGLKNLPLLGGGGPTGGGPPGVTVEFWTGFIQANCGGVETTWEVGGKEICCACCSEGVVDKGVWCCGCGVCGCCWSCGENGDCWGLDTSDFSWIAGCIDTGGGRCPTWANGSRPVGLDCWNIEKGEALWLDVVLFGSDKFWPTKLSASASSEIRQKWIWKEKSKNCIKKTFWLVHIYITYKCSKESQ